MAYKDTTKVPQRIILWFTGPGYVTFKIGGHASVTQGTLCKFLSNPSSGVKSHPIPERGFYFPRPHPSGCLLLLQALRCRQENISLFSQAWFQQGIISLSLQLSWSCSLVEQGFHWSWVPPARPPLPLLSFRLWRTVHKHFVQPLSVGVAAAACRPCFKRPVYHSIITAAWG